MLYRPINSIEDSFKHRQAEAMGMINTMDFEACANKQLKLVGLPVKFGDTKAFIRRRPPLLSERTQEILGEVEIDDEKIQWFKEHGIV
jgi:succinate--hydroxymethylglutarate CoA-transferase